MHCKNCFRQLPDGVRFCKCCGQPVEGPAQSGQKKWYYNIESEV